MLGNHCEISQSATLNHQTVMICENCREEISKNLITGNIKEICKCTKLCNFCFLEKYILYNTQPIEIIYRCSFCNKTIGKEVRNWIFSFAKEYFESEGPFPNYYL